MHIILKQSKTLQEALENLRKTFTHFTGVANIY